MKIKVDEDVFDVEVLENGSWKFSWFDDGRLETHTYTKEKVHEFLVERQFWTIVFDEEVITGQQVKEPNYAAAFNMWMNDYMNNPQAYEDSHDSAVRHLKEKLNGEEPSYGAVCAEVLVNYLEKV